MVARTFRNWNGSAYSTPSAVAEPRDLEELVEIVRDRDRYPSPVRAAGSFHSLNECFATTGTQVLARGLDEIRVDLAARIVTVGAGVTMVRLRDTLRPFGMQTEVTPEIGNATAGSVACCGTKDASLRGGLAQVSSTVVGVRLVNPKGEVEEVSEETDPERMRVIRSSYGLLGVLAEVTFRIQPVVRIHTDYASLRMDPPPTRDEMFGGADGVLGIALPYANRIVVERRWARRGGRVGRYSSLKRRVRDVLWETGASRFGTLLPYDWYLPVLDRLLVLPLHALRLLGGFDGMRYDSTIEFEHDRRHYFDFTFCAVPMSRWQEFVPAYLRFCEEYRRETRFRPTLLSEVYVMARDQHSLLSPTPTEESFTMDVTHTTVNDQRWKGFNRRFNELVADHGGRPLLNQTKELTREVVHRMLGEDWRRFLDIREREDPDGRFLNRYFRELM